MRSNNKSGQLLYEIVFASAIAAVVLTMGASLLYTGLRGNAIFIERDNALGLVEETFEGIKLAIFESWNGGTTPAFTHPKGVDPAPVNAQDITSRGLLRGSTNKYFPSKLSDSSTSAQLWTRHNGEGLWGTAITVKAISPLAINNVWTVAGSNAWRYDGAIWENMEVMDGGSANTQTLNDIVAFSPNSSTSATNVVVVGDMGRVYEFNGSTWTRLQGAWLENNFHIGAVSKHRSGWLYAVGTNGHVWKYDGALWTRELSVGNWDSATINDVVALSPNSTSNALWIVGENGNVWRKDSGGAWDPEATLNCNKAGKSVRGVSLAPGATSGQDKAWIIGSGGLVCEYTGNIVDGGGTWRDWTPPDASTRWGNSAVINAIRAFNGGGAHIVGDGGRVWGFVNAVSGGIWDDFPGAGKWGTSDMKNLGDYFSVDQQWFTGANGNVWELGSAKWRICTVGSDDCNLSSNCSHPNCPVNDNITTINSIDYKRSFYVQNVCRMIANSSIDRTIVGITGNSGADVTCPAGQYYDPQTIKATVEIDWTKDKIIVSRYITRWLNAICTQSSWDLLLSAAELCPPHNYSTASLLIATGSSLTLVGGTPNQSGLLYSSAIHLTGGARGPALNSIMWKGSKRNSGSVDGGVRLQISASDDVNQLFDFYGGEDCSLNGEWVAEPGEQVDLYRCGSILNNKKYLQYKVKLCKSADCTSTTDAGPRVDDIIINYSP